MPSKSNKLKSMKICFISICTSAVFQHNLMQLERMIKKDEVAKRKSGASDSPGLLHFPIQIIDLVK